MSAGRGRIAGAAILVLLLVWFSPARSARAEPPRGSPFDVRWEVDLPVTAVSLLVGVVPEIPGLSLKSELGPPRCGLTCDKMQINALDRTVVGNHSKTAGLVSDVFVVSNVALPIAVFDAIDVGTTRPPDGWRGYGKDAMVLAEVASVDWALNSVVKFAVRRPRPLAYDPVNFSDQERLDPEASLSFYSQHSSLSFAMATAYSYLFTLRHPRHPLVPWVWAFTEGMATATAVLRVAAGKHFWTDVITGAGVGAGLGVLIPALHRTLELPVPAWRGSVLRLLPTTMPGGGGLLLALE